MLLHAHDLTVTLKLTHLHSLLVLCRLLQENDCKTAIWLTLLVWFELAERPARTLGSRLLAMDYTVSRYSSSWWVVQIE